MISIQCSPWSKATRSSSYRLVGSPQRQSVEQFREARFVSITFGALAISLDPLGMLDAKVVVNLLPKLGVSVDFVRHALLKRTILRQSL